MKKVVATTIAFGTLVILTLVITSSAVKQKSEPSNLESGNIQRAIETGQY
jgi:uncharacterized secreted protein with C-terminal beta-propeller domain